MWEAIRISRTTLTGSAAPHSPPPHHSELIRRMGHEAVASLNVINRQGLAVSVADGDVVRELALELLSTPSFSNDLDWRLKTV